MSSGGSDKDAKSDSSPSDSLKQLIADTESLLDATDVSLLTGAEGKAPSISSDTNTKVKKEAEPREVVDSNELFSTELDDNDSLNLTVRGKKVNVSDSRQDRLSSMSSLSTHSLGDSDSQDPYQGSTGAVVSDSSGSSLHALTLTDSASDDLDVLQQARAATRRGVQFSNPIVSSNDSSSIASNSSLSLGNTSLDESSENVQLDGNYTLTVSQDGKRWARLNSALLRNGYSPVSLSNPTSMVEQLLGLVSDYENKADAVAELIDEQQSSQSNRQAQAFTKKLAQQDREIKKLRKELQVSDRTVLKAANANVGVSESLSRQSDAYTKEIGFMSRQVSQLKFALNTSEKEKRKLQDQMSLFLQDNEKADMKRRKLFQELVGRSPRKSASDRQTMDVIRVLSDDRVRLEEENDALRQEMSAMNQLLRQRNNAERTRLRMKSSPPRGRGINGDSSSSSPSSSNYDDSSQNTSTSTDDSSLLGPRMESVDAALDRYERKLSDLKLEHKREVVHMQDKMQLLNEELKTNKILLSDARQKILSVEDELVSTQLECSSRPTAEQWRAAVETENKLRATYDKSEVKRQLEVGKKRQTNLKTDLRACELELDKARNKIKVLKEQNATLQLEVDARVPPKESRKQAQTVAHLRKQIAENDASNVVNQQHISEYRTKWKECKEELEDAADKVRILKSKLLEADVDVEEAKKVAEEMTKQARKTGAELERANNRIQILVEKNVDVDGKLSDVRKSEADLNKAIKQANKSAERATTERERAMAKVEILEDKVNQLQHALIQSRDDTAETRRVLQKARTDQRGKDTELELLSNERNRAITKSDVLSRKIAEYETNLIQTRGQAADLRKALKKCTDALKTKDAELEFMQDTKMKADAEFSNANDREQDLIKEQTALTKKLTQTSADLAKAKHQVATLSDEVENLRLEVESRPSVTDWRKTKQVISDLQRQVTQSETTASLRRVLDTSELIRRDKLDHRLGLHNVDDLPQPVCADIIKEICRLLNLKDVGKITPTLGKMNKLMGTFPGMKAFVRDVTLMVVYGSASGPNSAPMEVTAAAIEKVVPRLRVWAKNMKKMDEYHAFYEAVQNKLSERGGNIVGADASMTMEEKKRTFDAKITGVVSDELEQLLTAERELLVEREIQRQTDVQLKENGIDAGDSDTAAKETQVFMTKFIKHFQHLFDVSSTTGLYPKLNEVYLFVKEMRTALDSFRLRLNLSNSSSIQQCVQALDKELNINGKKDKSNDEEAAEQKAEDEAENKYAALYANLISSGQAQATKVPATPAKENKDPAINTSHSGGLSFEIGADPRKLQVAGKNAAVIAKLKALCDVSDTESLPPLLKRLLARLRMYDDIFPGIDRLISDLYTALDVSALEEILPAVQALK